MGRDRMGREAQPHVLRAHRYLQVITFLHVEVQPVLQLFLVPGFLQDALPLAKSLQATCFTAIYRQSPGFTGHPSTRPVFFSGRARRVVSRASCTMGGPRFLTHSLWAPVPIVVVLLNHTDAPRMEMDSEEV